MKKSAVMVAAVALVAASAIGNGCSDEDGTAGACVAGEARACACSGDGQGVQLCASDGSAWGACVCGAGGDGGAGGAVGGGGAGATAGAGGGGGGGGGTAMPGSAYEVPLTVPPCDANDPTVHFIENDEDWADINDPSFRLFCVRPGDYTAVGAIELTADGTAGEPRWIRFYDAAAPDPPLHPVQRGETDRAVVAALTFDDADDWVVQELTVAGDWTAISLDNGSERNVLDRLLLERARVVLYDGAHDNTLQNSVIRDAPMAADSDRVCVVLSGYSSGGDVAIHGTRIVNNEIYDCTDSIQLYRPNVPQGSIDFGGTIIDENDLYLTSATYSDCNGVLDPAGTCACAENGVDIKAAGTDSGNIVQVSRNRIWGFKRTDTQCGGTGSWGEASVVHFDARYTLFQDNLLWDNARGLVFGNEHHSVVDNVIVATDNPNDDEGYAIVLGAARSEVYRNVIVDARNWGQVEGADCDWRCNTLIRAGSAAGSPGSGTLADYNFYFDSEALSLPGDHDVVFDDADAAEHAERCFLARRWTGPEQICLPLAEPTVASPHAGACDPSLGSRAGVGVGDELW